MNRVLRVALLALAACGGGSSSTSEVCAPGQQVACPCSGGAQGIQACGANGSGFSACECPTGSGPPLTCMDTPKDPRFANNYCNNATDKCFLQDNGKAVYDAATLCAATNGNTAPGGGAGSQPGCLQYASAPSSSVAVKCMQDCITHTIAGLSADCASCVGALRPPGTDASCLVSAFADCAGFTPSAKAGCL